MFPKVEGARGAFLRQNHPHDSFLCLTLLIGIGLCADFNIHSGQPYLVRHIKLFGLKYEES